VTLTLAPPCPMLLREAGSRRGRLQGTDGRMINRRTGSGKRARNPAGSRFKPGEPFFLSAPEGADSNRSESHAVWPGSPSSGRRATRRVSSCGRQPRLGCDRNPPCLCGRTPETWAGGFVTRVGPVVRPRPPSLRVGPHSRDQAPVTLCVRGRLRSQQWEQTHLTLNQA
jgi:hypothetical protein